MQRTHTSSKTSSAKASVISRMAMMACLFALPVVMTACNTIQGAGEDVEKAGEAVQDAAS